MRKFRYNITLALYPLGFFVILASVQFAILARAYQAQQARNSEPYVDGAPIPAVVSKIDRRPQSINLP